MITQIFDRRDKYIIDDALLAVKPSLLVDFLPRNGDPITIYELPYNFKLAKFESARENGGEGTTEESASFGAESA